MCTAAPGLCSAQDQSSVPADEHSAHGATSLAFSSLRVHLCVGFLCCIIFLIISSGDLRESSDFPTWRHAVCRWDDLTSTLLAFLFFCFSLA